MANTKIHTLVAQQLPEFIQSDYQTFVAFLEAYYAWMESSGNPLSRSVQVLQSLDVDRSLSDFISYFCKEFIPGIPEHLIPNKAFLIAHAKEFYRTKGTEKSFELLFRLLFNEDISIVYPKDSILRVSDGKWEQQRALRLDPTLFSEYTGNGSNTEFRLLGRSDDIGTVDVYIDDVLQSTGYTVSNNRPYIFFDVAPTNGSVIRINYRGFNLLRLFNTNQIVTTITGQTSGATAISETAEQLFISGIELFNLNISSVTGTFQSGESVILKYTYDYANNYFINLQSELTSIVNSIEIVNGGANYNIGDPVLLIGGDPDSNATAVVEDIYSSIVTNIVVLNGGCGYQAGQEGYITSTPNTGLTFAIGSVDTSGRVHPNSYPIVTDVLSLFANTIMSNSNYWMFSSGTENANSVIMNALSSTTYGGSGPQGLGPITNVAILLSTQNFITSPTLRFDAPVVTVNGNTANGNTATANVSIGYFGILGRMNVISGGSNYQVGDELVFTNVPGIGIGVGAAGEVTEVHAANGGIKSISFQPSRVTGTVNASANIIIGNGTSFNTELLANDRIEINNEISYVQTITNATHLIVNTTLTRTSTNRKLGVFGRYFVGGINYSMNALPTITVNSNNVSASGANVVAEGVISGGEILSTESDEGISPGRIRAIRIVSPGYGYMSAPIVDLTGSGNGQANAIAILLANMFTSEGHFLNQDGMVSSDRKIQGIEDIYHQHSYVIRSEVALNTYKNIFKTLIHPAGLQLFGEYMVEDTIETSAASQIANGNLTITTP